MDVRLLQAAALRADVLSQLVQLLLDVHQVAVLLADVALLLRLAVASRSSSAASA